MQALPRRIRGDKLQRQFKRGLQIMKDLEFKCRS